MKYNIMALYVCIDDFSEIYEEWEQKKVQEQQKIEREKIN